MPSLSLTKAITDTRMPTGSIATFGVGTLPSGYLACDGTAVSRTTYAYLFSIIGTTYGSGDGSTTFNVPDLRGIFIRGVGSQTVSAVSYDGGTLGTKRKDRTNNTGLGATTTSTNSASVGASPNLSHTHSFSDRFFSSPQDWAYSTSDALVFTWASTYSNSEVGRTTGNPNVSLNHTHTTATNTVVSTTTFNAEDNETAPGAFTILYGIRT